MTSTAIVGSTGLVVSFLHDYHDIALTLLQGSHLLSTLLALPSISSVHAIARRQPSSADAKLTPLVSSENTQWASQLSSVKPAPGIFFSALGTTKAAAGSFENQRKIDYDLNLALAKAAKESGVKVYVLISSSGANPHSMIAYSKMKGELEDSVKALDFDHTVILRPGVIVGTREDSRPTEFVLRKVAGFLGGLSHGLKDTWAQV